MRKHYRYETVGGSGYGTGSGTGTGYGTGSGSGTGYGISWRIRKHEATNE